MELVAQGEDETVSTQEIVPLIVKRKYFSPKKGTLNIVTNPQVPLFTEGVSGKVVFFGRTLEGVGGTQSLTILNPPSGSRQEGKGESLEMTWTPSDGMVEGGGEYTTSYPLKVKLQVKNAKGTVSVTKTINLVVQVVVVLPLFQK